MENRSGLIPLGHRLVVCPDPVEEKTASGIVMVREAVGRDEMAQVWGTVVAVGNGCWRDTPTHSWAQEGDRIMFGKYSGLKHVAQDGGVYRIINDLDVVAKAQA
jgi:co-chaperonin GroES (HSP10)